jgi:MYXO-CTERM domain-containing protein
MNAIEAGSYTEDFSGTQDSNLYSGGGFSYEATTPESFGIRKTGDYLSTYFPENSVGISFTSANVTAFGGNFWPADAGDNLTGSVIQLQLNDGTTATYSPATKGEFRGFVSDGLAFTSFSLSEAPTNTVGKPYMALDSLTVGTAKTSSVPEADSALLTLTAAGLLLSLRRRHRA